MRFSTISGRCRLQALVMVLCLSAAGAYAQSTAMGVPPSLTRAQNQQQAPITWKVSSKMTASDEGVIILTARMLPGWHLYGMNMPEGGPHPTRIKFQVPAGVELTGQLTVNKATVRHYDDMFGAELEFWEGESVTFTRPFRLTGETDGMTVSGSISYMGCNDETCMSPQSKDFSIQLGK